MILTVESLLSLPQFTGVNEEELKLRLDAVEGLVRAYTNNNFQQRSVRFVAASLGDRLLGYSPFLKVGDTVQISQSKVNDSLYTITEVSAEEQFIRVDRELYPVINRVTKVVYPADVKAGVRRLLEWDYGAGQKVGIKSETLSRHSVTYYDQDTNNTCMGYPVSLMGFLKPYMKARF